MMTYVCAYICYAEACMCAQVYLYLFWFLPCQNRHQANGTKEHTSCSSLTRKRILSLNSCVRIYNCLLLINWFVVLFCFLFQIGIKRMERKNTSAAAHTGADTTHWSRAHCGMNNFFWEYDCIITVCAFAFNILYATLYLSSHILFFFIKKFSLLYSLMLVTNYMPFFSLILVTNNPFYIFSYTKSALRDGCGSASVVQLGATAKSHNSLWR